MTALFNRLTWFLTGIVVVTAVSAVVPFREPRLPGTIRFGVLAGPGPFQTLRAVRPLCDYLGLAVRRTVQPSVATVDELRGNAGRFDLALVPAFLVDGWQDAQVLAWSKTRAMIGIESRPYALFPRDRGWWDLAAPRVIYGDRTTWTGGRGAHEYLRRHGHEPDGFDRVAYGHNPYDHAEAIAALAHGAYDLAIVREADLRTALDTGVIDRARFDFVPAGPPGGSFALVAGPTLSRSARRDIRSAALNLDHYRYDKMSLRVKAVLEASGVLGLEGFGPAELFPSLRP